MENLVTKSIYNGFELLEKRILSDINSEGFLFEHKKSGAKLLYISNEDDNKVFSISFRTPSHNSTGVAHILEHCTLCGSKKYQAKEPFVELLKGSLNTFLNAMTFSDKTMYPIASQNDKDFMNLIDVYMDAVFNPLIYTKPQIFLQEGWHYSLENIDEPLTYKGVVYNEMKGAYSSGDRVLNNAVAKSLFPDTQYKYSSGGDPNFIPDLSYTEFLEFHKKYYHPSNSYIYLYGNGDILNYLKYLDTNYLQSFDRIALNSKIKIQPPLNKQIELFDKYSIGADESIENKTYLALNFVVGNTSDAENVFAMDILNFILLGTPASPLKKALLESGIGKSIYGYVDSSICQPVFSIVAENANIEDKLNFKTVVYDTLKNLVNTGIDKKLIEGAINIFEFTFREADFGHRPKGLTYNIQAMSSWLYGNDPMAFMEFNKYFKNIKTALSTNYFENIILKYLLNSDHSSIVVVSPQKNLEFEVETELANKLQKVKQSLSTDELNKILKTENDLKRYQQTSDTKEVLEQIPILELKDISKKALQIETEIIKNKNYDLIMHTDNTNKIIYLNLYFDTTTVPQDMIPYISLLSNMIGKLSTTNYTYEQLSNEVTIYTGGIGFSAEVYSDRDGNYYPKFFISARVLTDKLPKLLELLVEIINNTLYSEDKRIKEILKEHKTDILTHLLSHGNIAAARRVVSNVSKVNLYEDYISNISYYEFLYKLENNIDNDIAEIKQKLSQTANYIFNIQNLIISSVVDKDDKQLFLDNISNLTDNLRNEIKKNYKYELTKQYSREAFLTASKIQYVAKAGSYKNEGYKFNGHMLVLETILDLDYLWNEVRVQGGAYGVLISISKNGYILMSSYRDPNIKQTINAYENAYKYLSNFNIDKREMTKYIIGTINSIDRPLSCAAKNRVMSTRYIAKVSQEQLQKDRDEILSTDLVKIKEYIEMLNKVMHQNNIVVIGNENAIKQNRDLFEDLNTCFQN